MFRFEKLEIWELGIEYGNRLYDVAETFPKSEQFSLTSQLKRATVSISNNIAEGSGAATSKDFKNYLDIAIKSSLETVNILFFAQRRKFVQEGSRLELYEEAKKLIRKIRSFKKTLR